MKKLFVVLMLLLVCLGCSKSNDPKGSCVYQIIDHEKVKDIDNNMPSEVDIDDNINYVGLCFYDEDAQEIIDMFKQMKIVEEVGLPEDFETSYSLAFHWGEDDFCYVDFLGDVLYFYDLEGNEKFYKVSDEANLLGYAQEVIEANFDPNTEYVEILNYEGLSISQGSCDFEENNYSVELEIKNESDKAYAVSLRPTVNGYPIHSYQSLICDSGYETGYYVQIPLETLALYGINNPTNIAYNVDVYNYDSEKYEVLDYVTSSDIIHIDYEGTKEEAVESNVIYEDDKVDVCLQLSEHDLYTCMNLYVINKANVESVAVSGVELNGETIDMTGYDEVYNLNTLNKAEMFALLPLSNYEYNSETYESKKIDIESLKIKLAIDGKETDYIVIK